MRPAVESLLRLRPSLSALSDAGSTPGAFFPASVARRFHAWSGDGPAPVRYAFRVCHRCNATVPALRYCEESQDSTLQQYFGWYVSQAYLRLGILPYRHAYLAEVCPPGVQAEIEATRRLEQDFRDQCSRLLDGMPPASCNVAPSCGELEQEDVRKLVDLRQRASAAFHLYQPPVSNRRRAWYAAREWVKQCVTQPVGAHFASRRFCGNVRMGPLPCL
jgi:hypothetical protein